MLQFSRLTQLQTKYKFKYKNDEIYFKSYTKVHFSFEM
jgi:hypothetical protein